MIVRYRNLFANWVRDLTSNFRKAFPRWYSTVLGLMKSCAAMSRFVWPSAARREIWASCAVSWSKRRAGVVVGSELSKPWIP